MSLQQLRVCDTALVRVQCESHWVLAEPVLLRAVGPYEYGWRLLEKRNLNTTLFKAGYFFKALWLSE